jgi:hypothetical protein
MKAFAPAYSLAYCIAYAVVFVLDAPLFLYYPMEGRFAWIWAPYASIGPAMAWYGLVAAAALVAAPVALLVPPRMFAGRGAAFLWLLPVSVLGVCAWRLKFFFA